MAESKQNFVSFKLYSRTNDATRPRGINRNAYAKYVTTVM